MDLGCGEGGLTEAIAMAGNEVVGVDSSESIIEAARKRGLNAHLMSGDALSFEDAFDAVFTNAAIHWITDYRRVIEGVARALKPNGRFVGEFGGQGNMSTLIAAMETVVTQNAEMGAFRNAWFFPTDREYATYLENGGFVVTYIELIPRPTLLPAGLRQWLEVFARHAVAELPERSEHEFLNQVERLAKPALYSDAGGWHADYVRLRFHAEDVLVKQRGIGMFVADGARERLLAALRARYFDDVLAPALAEARRIGIDADELVERVRAVVAHTEVSA